MFIKAFRKIVSQNCTVIRKVTINPCPFKTHLDSLRPAIVYGKTFTLAQYVF